MDSVAIVVLNWNGMQDTLRCLASIEQQTYSNFKVILIDNGSTDKDTESGLAELTHTLGNRLHIIRNDSNKGFAGGVNIGIRYAQEHNQKYVALVNNDATLAKDWLQILIDALGSTESSSATGLLLSGDGKRIESTGDSYSAWGLPFPRQRDEEVSAAYDSGFVFGGTAGASVYTTSLFDEIGLFDEVFFAYFEDTDISFRAQLAGHRSYYEKTALAFHDHGTTSSKIPGLTVLQTFKNLPLFFWKDVPIKMIPLVGVRFFAVYALMYIRALLRGQFMVATKGVFYSFLYFPHAIRERWRIQKMRKVSYKYLRSIIYPDLPPNNKRYARRIFHR